MTGYTFSSIIEEWAGSSGLFLPREGDAAGRYVFHKSNKCGECFQIIIFFPENGIVIIEVWSLETRDDRECHFRWDVSVTNLFEALNLALGKVNAELKL